MKNIEKSAHTYLSSGRSKTAWENMDFGSKYNAMRIAYMDGFKVGYRAAKRGKK